MSIEQLEHSRYPIETIKSPEGSEVSFSPARGGIVTGVKLNATDILYLNQATFDDPAQNVKGGIPILFPQAGPLKDSMLKQHGFARTATTWRSTLTPDGRGFAEVFEADDATRQAYPHNFRLTMRGRLEENGSFTLAQEVSNLDAEKDLPLSMGLHPYFPVAATDKEKIVFDFPGGNSIAKDIANWSQGGTTMVANPGVPLRVSIPDLGTLVFEISPEYKRIWVWSKPGEDFVCIEPVMRDPGGLTNDPELVKPGSTLVGRLNITLEK
jgi:galactose mutarotase-like enzyme